MFFGKLSCLQCFIVVSKTIKNASCLVDNDPIIFRIWPTIKANRKRATIYDIVMKRYSYLVFGAGLLPMVEAVFNPNKNE